MKNKILGLVAFNVTAVFVIAQGVSIYLTLFLAASLVLADILILLALRRGASGKPNSSNEALVVLDWTSWTVYIPVVGGGICILIGVMRLAWRPCVIGLVAITLGAWRVWAYARVRRPHQNRH